MTHFQGAYISLTARGKEWDLNVYGLTEEGRWKQWNSRHGEQVVDEPQITDCFGNPAKKIVAGGPGMAALHLLLLPVNWDKVKAGCEKHSHATLLYLQGYLGMETQTENASDPDELDIPE